MLLRNMYLRGRELKKRQVNDKHKIQDRGISVWRQVDQIREEFTGSFYCSGNILIFRQNYNFIN